MYNKTVGYNVQAKGGQPLFPSKNFIFLLVLMLAGVPCGAGLSIWLKLMDNEAVPLLVSGIPVLENGLLWCLSTFLVHSLIYYIVLFLLGLTMFGFIAIALTVFLKGFFSGIAVSYYLAQDSLSGLAEAAICYAPFLAISGFFLIICAVISMRFSVKLARYEGRKVLSGFALKDYLAQTSTFMVLAVLSSLMGFILVWLYSLILS